MHRPNTVARQFVANRIVESTSRHVQKALRGGAQPEDVAKYVELQHARLVRLGYTVVAGGELVRIGSRQAVSA